MQYSAICVGSLACCGAGTHPDHSTAPFPDGDCIVSCHLITVVPLADEGDKLNLEATITHTHTRHLCCTQWALMVLHSIVAFLHKLYDECPWLLDALPGYPAAHEAVEEEHILYDPDSYWDPWKSPGLPPPGGAPHHCCK